MNTLDRPLIILGAGASHDFVNHNLRHYPIPPLTDHLVKSERLDYSLLQKYPEAKDLFSHVAPLVLREDRSLTFEEAVGGVASHAELTALRFYLSDYFNTISNGVLRQEHINNYRALIRNIKNSPAKGADILTFNYDTLFESQLEGWPFIDTGRYISENEPIRIFKLHGSSDWFYIQRKSSVSSSVKLDTAYAFLKSYSNFKGEHIFTRAMLQENSEADSFYHIPALALPTSTTKTFVMPGEHIHPLTEILSKASRILIIGWKAGDKHLLKLMDENIKRIVPVYLVTGPGGGKEVKKNLLSVKNLEIAGEEKGFSAFIGSPMADTFFQLKKN